MTKDERVATLQSLVGRLLDAATYTKSMDQTRYDDERRIVLDDPVLGPAAPAWLKTHRDLEHFRAYAQTLGGYKERRALVRVAFEPTFDAAEQSTPPVADTTQTALRALSSEEVDRIWRLALERTHRDPDGALTLARTLLESVMKHVLDDAELSYDDGATLPALYKTLSDHLNLAPAQHDREAFKAILGAVATIVSRLAELRNSYSDSHGRGRRAVKITSRHAALAVNLAGTVAAFVVETWQLREA